MINSRDLMMLKPRVKNMANDLIMKCKECGIDLLVTSTYRDIESQNALYAIGRTLPGKKVTNAKGGQSFHNYQVAFDVVPIVNGKAMWSDEDTWKKIGAIGVSIGLEWAGNWHSFREFPHFQLTDGLTLKDFQNGKTIKG